jgi:hypothetical protein
MRSAQSRVSNDVPELISISSVRKWEQRADAGHT